MNLAFRAAIFLTLLSAPALADSNFVEFRPPADAMLQRHAIQKLIAMNASPCWSSIS
jgi:hypothetical protein